MCATVFVSPVFRRTAIIAVLAVMFIGNVHFLFGYKTCLHCTQYTSFSIALQDMKAHIEEPEEFPIYKEPYAIPLRVLFGTNLVVYLFFPVLYSLVKLYRPMPISHTLKVMAFFVILFTLNTILSAFLAGERFLSLNIYGGGWGLFVYVVCFAGLCYTAYPVTEDKTP